MDALCRPDIPQLLLRCVYMPDVSLEDIYTSDVWISVVCRRQQASQAGDWSYHPGDSSVQLCTISGWACWPSALDQGCKMHSRVQGTYIWWIMSGSTSQSV